MLAPHSRTISEKILSARCGRGVRAGDIAVCNVDWVVGTDASSPMAIDYFRQMQGETLFDPSRVMFAMDHYSPPRSPSTRAFHEEMRAFALEHGAHLHEIGEGISFQLLTELGRALPGSLIIGADSHTVTCGALGLFATGVGSSDLAAAMITGQVWLRVPETIRVWLVGVRPADVSAKDIALAVVNEIGADGATYATLEFAGSVSASLTLEERLVVCNLAVETDAKASIFPADANTSAYLNGRTLERGDAIMSDHDAIFAREVKIDVSTLSPRVSLPHQPDSVVPLADAVGTPVHMVFIGTCTGGRVRDVHEALHVLQLGGGRIADGVQLVVTPASREVSERLEADGTMRALKAMGAIVTETGCGACCGTSGVIPGDGANVLSTANRNFRGRMGNARASIYLASPAACAAAALTGFITMPPSAERAS